MLGLTTCLFFLCLLSAGTLRRPTVAFAAVLCLYGLKQWGQSSTAFFAAERTFMNFAVAVLVAIGMLRNLRRHADAQFISSVWVLTLVLYGYAFCTVLWSPNSAASLEQWSLQAPYVLMIAIVAPLLVKSAEDTQHAVHWTMLVGGAICALAFFYGDWGLRGLRVNGDFLRTETNPLAIASLGGTIGVIAMVTLIVPGGWLKKALCVTAALIGIAVILRSGSRGQLVAMIAAVLVGMPIAAKRASLRSWLMIAVAALVVTQIGWWIWDGLGVDSARWSSERSAEDAEGRLMMASSLISAAVKEPMKMLVGLGNSSAFYYVGFYPHIAALEVLAEEGLVGFGIYCMILILTIRNILQVSKNLRGQNDDVGKYAVAVIAALFLFEWILTFKQGTLLSSVYVFSYAAILGAMSKRCQDRPVLAKFNQDEGGAILAHPNLMR